MGKKSVQETVVPLYKDSSKFKFSIKKSLTNYNHKLLRISLRFHARIKFLK